MVSFNRFQHVQPSLGLLLFLMLAGPLAPAGAEPRPPVLKLPAFPEELITYCRSDSSLSDFARHGEVLTSGLQILLLGSSVPIADMPHVDWARPYYRGRIKILAFLEAPHYREIAAIYRGLDCELSIVQMPPGNWFESIRQQLYQGYSAVLARKALQQPCDVIFLCSGLSSGPKNLPPDIQTMILEKVKNGAGLVLNGCTEVGGGHPVVFWPENTSFAEVSLAKAAGGRVRLNPLGFSVLERGLVDGIPFSLFPPIFALPLQMSPSVKMALNGGKTPPTWQYNDKPVPPPPVATEGPDTPLVITGRYGQGKVVSTGWATNAGFPVVDLNDRGLGILRYEEYFVAMLSKLILWAADRQSEWDLRVEIPKAASPEGFDVKVFVSGESGKKFPLRLEAVARDMSFRSVWRGEAVAAPGDGPAAFGPILLPSGRYAFDVIARTRSGESVNWASSDVTVAGPERLELNTGKESFRREEMVTVSGWATGLGSGLYRIEARVTDAFGRLLREETLPPGPRGEFELKHSLAHAMTSIHTVEATLFRGPLACAKAEATFYCPTFGWDDFHNILWGDAPHVEILRDWAGIDTYLGAGWPGHEYIARAASEYGLPLLWTNVALQNPEQTQQEPEKSEVLYDEQVQRVAQWINRYGAIGVCFQDERHSFQDPAPNGECLRRFRQWLQEQYGDLERLNASWETAYKAWEEVQPLRTDQFQPDRRNLAPWLDFRLFISKLTIDIDARQAEALRKGTDPDIYIGIEGVFGLGGHIVPYSGFDYAEHARRCFNMIMPYDNETNSVTSLARSFCPGPLSTWDGYSAPPWQYYSKPWWGALHGYWGMSWFASVTFATSTGCLFPQAQWVEESTRKLRQGAGKLLMTSERMTDPVVFLYSQPSIYAAYIAGRWIDPRNKHLMNRPSTQWGRENLQRLVNEFGLQYSYVSERQVEAGGLNGKKLLILPDVMCMSRKTAETIENFVREGGVVMADLAPALWDEHGRPVKPGYLDKLFGVTRDTFEYGRRPTDYLVGTTQSEPDFPVANEWFIGEYYERSLKLDGGKALGVHIFEERDIPAFVFHRTGKGASVLMNFLETNYSRYPEGRQRVFMRALLELAKVEPPVQVCDSHGASLYQYDISRFQDGDNLYVGVYRMTTSSSLYPEEVTVRLPKSGHLYEVKSEKYLGFGREARVKVPSGGSALVAILPYSVEGVKLKAFSARPGQPMRLAAWVLASEAPGRHILHLEVFDPKGKIRRAYTRNVEAKQGRWDGEIPTALNDPAGKWRVRVKEGVTGMEAEASFRLR